MTTAPEPVDDNYPSSWWKPREARERDRAFQPTEAELWLSSLSDIEFQQLVLRCRGRS